ncbi:hypothetical protein L596_028558 [Steinernema carpocapsae]|uniref:Uncharacterized protein n=1 Tax=Steinernema carpocapsae TaxID=34508 RepID=A0A4U5LZQ9_STECR|nr:hypothetical protein L596_028558 [Steinernema carpocapsae]
MRAFERTKDHYELLESTLYFLRPAFPFFQLLKCRTPSGVLSKRSTTSLPRLPSLFLSRSIAYMIEKKDLDPRNEKEANSTGGIEKMFGKLSMPVFIFKMDIKADSPFALKRTLPTNRYTPRSAQ